MKRILHSTLLLPLMLISFNASAIQTPASRAVAPEVTISVTKHTFAETRVDRFSEEFSYTVSATDLSDSVRIIAPENFQVSLISGDYSGDYSSAVIPHGTGSFSNVKVYCRFRPDYDAIHVDSIRHSTGAATDILLAVTGKGVDPEINVNPASINFKSMVLGTSSIKYYSVSAIAVDGNLKLEAPAFCKLSLDSNDFDSKTNLLEITPENDTILSTNIYVLCTPNIADNITDSIKHWASNNIENYLTVMVQGFIPNSINKTESNNNISIVLYPQPANNNLSANINCSKAGVSSFIISDLNGRIVLTNEILTQEGANTISFDTQHLEGGIYIFSHIKDDQKPVHQQFIIQ